MRRRQIDPRRRLTLKDWQLEPVLKSDDVKNMSSRELVRALRNEGFIAREAIINLYAFPEEVRRAQLATLLDLARRFPAPFLTAPLKALEMKPLFLEDDDQNAVERTNGDTDSARQPNRPTVALYNVDTNAIIWNTNLSEFHELQRIVKNPWLRARYLQRAINGFDGVLAHEVFHKLQAAFSPGDIQHANWIISELIGDWRVTQPNAFPEFGDAYEAALGEYGRHSWFEAQATAAAGRYHGWETPFGNAVFTAFSVLSARGHTLRGTATDGTKVLVKAHLLAEHASGGHGENREAAQLRIHRVHTSPVLVTDDRFALSLTTTLAANEISSTATCFFTINDQPFMLVGNKIVDINKSAASQCIVISHKFDNEHVLDIGQGNPLMFNNPAFADSSDTRLHFPEHLTFGIVTEAILLPNQADDFRMNPKSGRTSEYHRARHEALAARLTTDLPKQIETTLDQIKTNAFHHIPDSPSGVMSWGLNQKTAIGDIQALFPMLERVVIRTETQTIMITPHRAKPGFASALISTPDAPVGSRTQMINNVSLDQLAGIKQGQPFELHEVSGGAGSDSGGRTTTVHQFEEVADSVRIVDECFKPVNQRLASIGHSLNMRAREPVAPVATGLGF